jgi:DDE superfamily endonuclease
VPAPAHRHHLSYQAQLRLHRTPASVDRLYGPKPGMPIKPIVTVLDHGPIHVRKATLAALAERAHWLIVEWLPKYAPELNDIEIVWGDLILRLIIWPTGHSPILMSSTGPSTRPLRP